MGWTGFGGQKARARALLAVASLALALVGCAAEGSDGQSGVGGLGGASGAGVTGGVGDVTSGTGGVSGAAGAAGVGATGGSSGIGGGGGGIGGMTGGVGDMMGGAGGMTGGAGGMTGGVGGGGDTGDGSFPRMSEPVDVELMGPYSFEKYAMTDPEWLDAEMYYPTDAPAPFAVMVVAPGFTETKENMTWWCEMLASHGFAVLNTTPNNTGTDQPPDRGVDLVQAVARAKAENEVADSPLKGKIAVDRMAVSGHSMGGGGTLYAASTLGDGVRAAVPLMEHGPYLTDTELKAIKAPTMFIAGDADPDLLGGPNMHSIPHFNGMTASVERVLMVISGGDHFMGVNGGAFQDVITRYAVAWLKMHLEDDTRYESYVYGADHTPAPFAMFETAP